MTWETSIWWEYHGKYDGHMMGEADGKPMGFIKIWVTKPSSRSEKSKNPR